MYRLEGRWRTDAADGARREGGQCCRLHRDKTVKGKGGLEGETGETICVPPAFVAVRQYAELVHLTVEFLSFWAVFVP